MKKEINHDMNSRIGTRTFFSYNTRYLCIFCVLGCIVPIFVLCGTMYGQSSLTFEDTAQLQASIENINNWETDAAKTKLRGFIQKYPNKPIGYFYYALIYWQYIAEDNTDTHANERFTYFINWALQKGRDLVRSHRADYLDYFYYGLATAFAARDCLQKEEWGLVAEYGRTTWVNIRTAMEENPRFIDAKFAQALLHFYADTVPESLQSIARVLGIEPNRELGIRELEYVYEHAQFLKPMVAYYLIVAHMHYTLDYDRAESILQFCIETYPRNLSYHRYQVYLYIRQHKYAAAQQQLTAYQNALNTLPEEERFVWDYKLSYLHGRLYYLQQDFDQALPHLRSVIDKHPDNPIQNYYTAWALMRTALIYDIRGNRNRAVRLYHILTQHTVDGTIPGYAKTFLEHPCEPNDPRLYQNYGASYYIP